MRLFRYNLSFTLLIAKIPALPVINSFAEIFLCYALFPNLISEKNRLKSSCFAYA